MAGAAGLAGVGEGGGQRRLVARSGRGSQLVKGGFGVLVGSLESSPVAPHCRQRLGVLVRARREQLHERRLEALELGGLLDGARGRPLGINDALDGAHCSTGLLAVLLALLDHVGLCKREGGAANHRAGGQYASDRHNQSLPHGSIPFKNFTTIGKFLLDGPVFVADVWPKANRAGGKLASR